MITSNNGVTSYGNTVRFSCRHGFVIVGSSARTCLNVKNQAVWSGLQPYCIRKFYGYFYFSKYFKIQNLGTMSFDD